ncbi:MBL fold metallo-hydrolase [Tepiditoga spiralis]|uniref:MBL fold metallo-hydrolase n=1 Tax=Tepiditoga spiralis TaxID=2108365 RepID=A0A7G1G7H9_9BACT|nr:MBL fold metallo-hydrolase [Tepiditoga spiralis]BBE32155.1 MBL fold metallo-hydrolase [Tepiditoga spiralis]
MLEQYNNIHVFWFENGASNVTFLETKNELIAFDSSFYGSKFDEMTNIMEEKTSKKLKKVFITHFHPDHSFGCLTSKKNFEIIMNIKTFSNLNNLTSKYLEDVSEISGYNCTNIKNKLNLKNIEIFEDTFFKVIEDTIISGKNVGGHTNDSTIYMLKPLNYLISGDLVFSRVHTEFLNENIDLWIKILKRLQTMNINKISPGHGIPGDIKLIKNQIEYLNSYKKNRNLKNLYYDYVLSEIVQGR